MTMRTDQPDDPRPTASAPVGVALGDRMRVPEDWQGIRDWRPRLAELQDGHRDWRGDDGDLVGAAR